MGVTGLHKYVTEWLRSNGRSASIDAILAELLDGARAGFDGTESGAGAVAAPAELPVWPTFPTAGPASPQQVFGEREGYEPYPAPRAIIAVDGSNLLHWLTAACLPTKEVPFPYLFGGDLRTVERATRMLVDAFRRRGILLYFIWDGPMDNKTQQLKAFTRHEKSDQRLKRVPDETAYLCDGVLPAGAAITGDGTLAGHCHHGPGCVTCAVFSALPASDRAKYCEVTVTFAGGNRTLDFSPSSILTSTVESVLKECGVVSLRVIGETDTFISTALRHCQSVGHPLETLLPVVGILSNDSDFAAMIGADCPWWPTDLLLLDGLACNLRKCPGLQRAVGASAAYIRPSEVASLLHLPPRLLPTLACLCGTDYTKPHLWPYAPGNPAVEALMRQHKLLGYTGATFHFSALSILRLEKDREEAFPEAWARWLLTHICTCAKFVGGDTTGHCSDCGRPRPDIPFPGEALISRPWLKEALAASIDVYNGNALLQEQRRLRDLKDFEDLPSFREVLQTCEHDPSFGAKWEALWSLCHSLSRNCSPIYPSLESNGGDRWPLGLLLSRPFRFAKFILDVPLEAGGTPPSFHDALQPAPWAEPTGHLKCRAHHSYDLLRAMDALDPSLHARISFARAAALGIWGWQPEFAVCNEDERAVEPVIAPCPSLLGEVFGSACALTATADGFVVGAFDPVAVDRVGCCLQLDTNRILLPALVARHMLACILHVPEVASKDGLTIPVVACLLAAAALCATVADDAFLRSLPVLYRPPKPAFCAVKSYTHLLDELRKFQARWLSPSNRITGHAFFKLGSLPAYEPFPGSPKLESPAVWFEGRVFQVVLQLLHTNVASFAKELGASASGGTAAARPEMIVLPEGVRNMLGAGAAMDMYRTLFEYAMAPLDVSQLLVLAREQMARFVPSARRPAGPVFSFKPKAK